VERLRDAGEHAFLARLRRRLRARPAGESESTGDAAARLLVGPGDDAAVFAPSDLPIAVTTDALVEGVHFRLDWLEAEELGERAAVVNLSDLAAMGARPLYTLAAITAAPDTPVSLLDGILDGCARASEAGGAAMIGGNLASARDLSITLTALGEIPGPRLSRAGARAGDELVVTGTLGGAAAAVARWKSGEAPSEELRRAWARPSARIAAGLALAAAGAHAAIDVSDGLLADLGHLCAASGVGAEIERNLLPRSREVATLDAAGADFAASGGEDYELLVACPPEVSARLDEIARETGTPLTRIGRCTDRDGEIVLLGADRRPHRPRAAGFDHFSGPPSA